MTSIVSLQKAKDTCTQLKLAVTSSNPDITKASNALDELKVKFCYFFFFHIFHIKILLHFKYIGKFHFISIYFISIHFISISFHFYLLHFYSLHFYSLHFYSLHFYLLHFYLLHFYLLHFYFTSFLFHFQSIGIIIRF